METIKDGAYGEPEKWQAEVECKKFDKYDEKGCGAVYRVDPTDLVLRYFEGTHFTHYYTAFQCVQCMKHTRVKDVPKPIVNTVFTDENKKKATFDGFSESIW